MKKLTRTGYVVTGVAVAAVLVSGSVAFAYWSTNGTGTGEAAAASVTDSVGIAQLDALTGLYPDGPSQDITVTITNPNDSDVTIGGVTSVVTGTSDPGCTAADFEIIDTVADIDVPGGGGSQTATVGTIAMIETGANQDACQDVTIFLAFTAVPA